ncbi:MAG: ROK family protein [Planctomycetota bacterium]|nr:ROK family protein [Planctomycetota bacterium]
MTDVIAVDLGGTNIRAARVDAGGKILARDKIATLADEGLKAVVGRIAVLVNKLKKASTVAVGVGTPGVPDPETGIMRLPAVNIAASEEYPLTGEISRLTSLPVFADNDGNLAALGEAWLGAGVGEHVVLIFTLGTGIGGGVVIDGKVYHGHHNMVAEFGHVSICYSGRPCPCGGTGCVEAYASAAALGRDARDTVRKLPAGHTTALLKLCGGPAGVDKVDAKMVCDAARDGDELACKLLDQCCDWLACGIGSLINAFNPSCVIIGGGMALAGELITSRVTRILDKGRVFGPIWKDCTLRLARLGDDAGLLGAARMAHQALEGTQEHAAAPRSARKSRAGRRKRGKR